MKILDATCGPKGMWYQKKHPYVTFMDERNGMYGNYKIQPDVVSEWKDMPFADNTFDMVVFDPPHIIQNSDNGNMVQEYGRLSPATWSSVLQNGIEQCFRVLKQDGFFVLKWAKADKFAHSIPIEQILKLVPYPPLFGTRTGKKDTNHWIVFIKWRPEQPLPFKSGVKK